jgi:hypothetical protein
VTSLDALTLTGALLWCLLKFHEVLFRLYQPKWLQERAYTIARRLDSVELFPLYRKALSTQFVFLVVAGSGIAIVALVVPLAHQLLLLGQTKSNEANIVSATILLIFGSGFFVVIFPALIGKLMIMGQSVNQSADADVRTYLTFWASRSIRLLLYFCISAGVYSGLVAIIEDGRVTVDRGDLALGAVVALPFLLGFVVIFTVGAAVLAAMAILGVAQLVVLCIRRIAHGRVEPKRLKFAAMLLLGTGLAGLLDIWQRILHARGDVIAPAAMVVRSLDQLHLHIRVGQYGFGALAQIVGYSLLLFWAFVAGARFLPDARRDRVASYLVRGARYIAILYQFLAMALVQSIIFVAAACTLAFFLASMLLGTMLQADRSTDNAITFLVLTVLIWGASAFALVFCVRQLIAILPSSISQAGIGALTVQNILIPIAMYQPRELDNVFSVILNALALTFFTVSGLGLLSMLAVARCLGAISSLICLAGVMAAEFLFFPILLGARLGRGRTAVELFTLIGWICTILGLCFALAIRILDQVQFSMAVQ